MATRSAWARSSFAPGASKPQVKAVTGRVFSRAIRVAMAARIDAPGQEQAVGHVRPLVDGDAVFQHRVEAGE